MAISMLYGAQNLKLVNGIVAAAPKGLGSRSSESQACCCTPEIFCLEAAIFYFRAGTLRMKFVPQKLGPKVEDVRKPVNPLVFLFRLILGATVGAYYVLVPIYMWIKDQALPKGQPI